MTNGLDRSSPGGGDQGFTLIELMVVVLIIAILLAIAIPTFLGARTRAQNAATQTLLRNTLTAEKTYYTDAQNYTDGTGSPNPLLAVEPGIPYNVGTMAAPALVGTVSLAVSADFSEVCLIAHSSSGVNFTLSDVTIGANQGTWYAKSFTGGCDSTVGASPAALNTTGWK
jgi:type IV pilus assembly protein PilA